jgi:hypothetical protein
LPLVVVPRSGLAYLVCSLTADQPGEWWRLRSWSVGAVFRFSGENDRRVPHREVASDGADRSAYPREQLVELPGREAAVTTEGRHLLQPLALRVGPLPSELPPLPHRRTRPRPYCGGHRCCHPRSHPHRSGAPVVRRAGGHPAGDCRGPQDRQRGPRRRPALSAARTEPYRLGGVEDLITSSAGSITWRRRRGRPSISLKSISAAVDPSSRSGILTVVKGGDV